MDHHFAHAKSDYVGNVTSGSCINCSAELFLATEETFKKRSRSALTHLLDKFLCKALAFS